MSNAGFSAAEEVFGSITGLTAKSHDNGRSSALAEAMDINGDTAAHDVHSDLLAPSVEYAVTASVTSLPALGSIVTWKTKKIMVTTIAINTQAGQQPTVTISGVEVESTATAARTYAVTVALSARAKAQDVAGAFSASTNFTAINTTFSIDPAIATVGGTPVASDAVHGRVEAQATMTDAAGSGSITAGSGFTITSTETESAPDADYITREATATKFLTGTEASS